MIKLLRIAILLAVAGAGAGCSAFAQDVDDLFEGSDTEAVMCECRHHTFSLDKPPEWLPKEVIAALAVVVRSDEGNWNGAVLFCPTTNAVIEQFPFKHAYRFLVCPSDWQGFKPKRVANETLVKHGIPIDKITAMFESVVMGPLEVSIRARHSGDMMGRIPTEDK